MEIEVDQEVATLEAWMETQIKVRNFNTSSLGCGFSVVALIAGFLLGILSK